MDMPVAVQRPVHALRERPVSRRQHDRLKQPPVLHQVMGRRLGNLPACIGVEKRALPDLRRTDHRIGGMEEAVVFEGEVRVDVHRADPIVDRPAVHEPLILRVLGHGEHVHHVLNGLLLPARGVRMLPEHVGGE